LNLPAKFNNNHVDDDDDDDGGGGDDDNYSRLTASIQNNWGKTLWHYRISIVAVSTRTVNTVRIRKFAQYCCSSEKRYEIGP